jgi:hypothetical protein
MQPKSHSQCLILLQKWDAVSQVIVCLTPHHNSFKLLLLEGAILTVARCLLGLHHGQLIAASPTHRLPFGIRQNFALKVNSSHRSILLPFGKLPPIIPVEAVAELPSSLTLRFQLDHDQEIHLCCHVQPATYDTSTVTYVLRRNFFLLPGSNALIKCVSILNEFFPHHFEAAARLISLFFKWCM